jgi:hypothetical protein
MIAEEKGNRKLWYKKVYTTISLEHLPTNLMFLCKAVI